MIIPRKGLFEIKKLLDAVGGEFEMAVEGAQLIVRHESTVLMVRLIEGKYPNYQQLIPHEISEPRPCPPRNFARFAETRFAFVESKIQRRHAELV